MSMFCYQCQEANHEIGCESRGVCGKSPLTSSLQDVLLGQARRLGALAGPARQAGLWSAEDASWLRLALFSTITNASFDDDSLFSQIECGSQRERSLLEGLEAARRPQLGEKPSFAKKEDCQNAQALFGIGRTEDADRRALRELMSYGLKGLAAYHHHASELGAQSPELEVFLETALAALDDEKLDVPALTNWVLQTGAQGVSALALLDAANTGHFGHQELTRLKLRVGDRPGILVTGHDLLDLEQLLEQSQGQGVDIYTNGEMLPAHAYPLFKKYPHLVSNYGGAWWEQTRQYEKFRGVILFTTNCLVPPPAGASYQARSFTTGAAGFPGMKHIAKDAEGKKDFSALIALAQTCAPPEALEEGELVIGTAHEQISAVTPAVIEAVKAGQISRFVVMAGCDGRHKSRSYYTEYAEQLPQDSFVLTAGCAKYRYNKLDLGEHLGLPRILDAGQCNDSYSLALTALRLKEAFGLEDINQLPIEYNIAWYEQKAVIVLLALLSLGVKNIQLGPTLPSFLSPGVAELLSKSFGLRLPEGLSA